MKSYRVQIIIAHNSDRSTPETFSLSMGIDIRKGKSQSFTTSNMSCVDRGTLYETIWGAFRR